MLICYAPDRARYFIERAGRAPRFWLETATFAGHVGADEQHDAAAHGKLWINCTTKGGRRYHRAVCAVEVMQSSEWAREPITEHDIKFRDYAIFHRWPRASASMN